MISRQYRLVGSSDLHRGFLTGLYGLDLTDVLQWFDVLDCSVSCARRSDDSLNLDRFLQLMNPSFQCVLQVGSPDVDVIRFNASGDVLGVSYFAWVECSFIAKNFDAVSGLYERVYGRRLE